MANPNRRLVVAAAQGLMRLEHPSIKVDGVWGQVTQDTFSHVSDDMKGRVQSTVEKAGYSMEDIAGHFATSADRQAMVEIVTRVAREEGVPPDLALKVVKLESAFNPNAKSPSGYSGLFQLFVGAMTDAHDFSSGRVDWVDSGTNGRVRLWRMKNPFDPEQNARVGSRYLRVLATRYLKVPMTTAHYPEIYMAFNIGFVGAKNVLAGRPNLAAQQIAANPRYGGGSPSAYFPALREAILAA